MYYMMLCVDCTMLYVHIGCVQRAIMSSMYVSHAAAPSTRLDFVLKCLESRVQTVRRFAAETLARRATVCLYGVKKYPGKGKLYSRTFFLTIFGLVRVYIRFGVV